MVKDEKTNIFGGEGSLKNPIFRGGVHKKNQYRRDCLKRGELEESVDLKGAWQERGVWCFSGGLDTPGHTVILCKE